MTPGLDDLRGEDGTVVGVAVDHRDSFRAALATNGVPDASDELIAEIKLDVCDMLAPDATMVLVDEPTLLRIRHGGRELAEPFAMPLEAQGYGALHEIERTRLLEHPTPVEMAADGAAAAKLLLPIRPDHVDRARAQVEIARTATEACRDAGLPLILEPIVFEAPDEQLEPERLAELVVAAARMLAPLEPGVLKLQHPGSADACHALHDACAGHPWLLLGGGARIDTLERQVAEARAAGAIGVIAGRTLFAGALTTDRDARRDWLRDVARPALQRLATAARPPARSESRM
jgi:tagatose-1,6-bisphosphate aldolase